MNDLLWTAGFIAIFCILLHFGNRWKIKYDTDGTVNQKPTAMDLTEFRESMKVKPPVLTEFDKQYLDKLKDSAARVNSERNQKTFDRKVLDGDIAIPKDIKNKDMLLIQDEWGPNPRLNPHYKEVRTGFDSHNWTEFKERNPELFHPKKPEDCIEINVIDEIDNSDPKKLLMLIEDEAGHLASPNDFNNRSGWRAKGVLKYKTTLTGSVLNGILFHETNGAVIHYTLEGTIPPDGDYIISGTLNGKVLNITSFKLVEII